MKPIYFIGGMSEKFIEKLVNPDTVLSLIKRNQVGNLGCYNLFSS